jgi:hypothetical protein
MKRVVLPPICVGKPGAAARHAEVALRYAWGETHGRVYAPHRLVVVNRVRELRRFLSYRYGETLPDDDAGRDDLELLLSYVMQLKPGYGLPAMIREARAWAPWLRREDARALAERIAGRRPAKFKDDTIAARIGCTYAERTALNLRSIGCCDLSRTERDKAARQRRTDAERKRRREKGVRPRDEYESKARATRAEADALGISYEALRKRRQRAAKAPVSQVRGNRIADIQRLPHTWDKDVKNPLDLHRQHWPHLLLIM